jgi:hypothetical protein
MPTYFAHGLVVDSELRLPELERAEEHGEPDVRIRVGDVPKEPDEETEDGKMYPVEDGLYLTFEGTGEVYGTDGELLVVEPEDDVDPGLFRWFTLCQGFRVLLHQRGHVVLHASATVVDGCAVTFLGKSGKGKSTTVAAWYASGYPILSDDVTAVDPETGLVNPSFPKIKLDPESASMFEADLTPAEKSDTLPRRYYAASQGYWDEAIPLGAIYVLDDGPELRIEDIPPAEQAYRLMCESASGYQSASDDAAESHFNDCVRLSELVPVKRLERPREFDILPELVQAVKSDLRETSVAKRAKK